MVRLSSYMEEQLLSFPCHDEFVPFSNKEGGM